MMTSSELAQFINRMDGVSFWTANDVIENVKESGGMLYGRRWNNELKAWCHENETEENKQ